MHFPQFSLHSNLVCGLILVLGLNLVFLDEKALKVKKMAHIFS